MKRGKESAGRRRESGNERNGDRRERERKRTTVGYLSNRARKLGSGKKILPRDVSTHSRSHRRLNKIFIARVRCAIFRTHQCCISNAPKEMFIQLLISNSMALQTKILLLRSIYAPHIIIRRRFIVNPVE